MTENPPNEPVEELYEPEQILRYSWAKASLALKLELLKADKDLTTIYDALESHFHDADNDW
jgi:hypothetical protein